MYFSARYGYGALIHIKGGLIADGTIGKAKRSVGGRNMAQPRSGKSLINESRYPYVVELVLPDDGLAIELNRRIVGFHKSRRIQPRHGRRIIRDDQTYSRWCFSDLATARAFLEQFGGVFYKTTRA
jgi:hypothetical protein